MVYPNQNLLVNGKIILQANTGEPTDWVHGGEADAPDLGDACNELLVVRSLTKARNIQFLWSEYEKILLLTIVLILSSCADNSMSQEI